ISFVACSHLYHPAPPLPLPSFPTRRSSDLDHLVVARARPQGADETRQGLIAGAFKYAGQHSLFGIQKTRWILRIQGLLNLLKLFFQLFNAHALGSSEEHTSELQSRFDLVCRLLLAKKNSQ